MLTFWKIIGNILLKLVKFGLSEKHTKFEKKSSSCFGRLLSKCPKHEEDCANFGVLLRKSELYIPLVVQE